ncbi:MAG: DUF1579 domain-containing protein [Alphaproteobacteria bacterium]|nr:DUF1579 domain-containing protein [Alphaproteobacteria bacterium]
MRKATVAACFAAMTLCAAARAEGAADFPEGMPETARAPFAAVAQLDGMLGAWRVTSEMAGPEGEWTNRTVYRQSFANGLRGLVLSEVHEATLEGDGFALKTDFSFDQYKNVYRLAVLDDTFGLMDIYEGNIEEGVLIVTNLRADTSFPLGDGRKMNFRLRIPVAGNRREMFVDQSVDGGETWAKFYRVVYERI